MKVLRPLRFWSAGFALLLLAACSYSRPSSPSLADSDTVESVAQQDSPQMSAEIDALAEASLVPGGPGVAVLVIEDTQILHAQGYGLSNIDTQTPITPETVFDLASVSKQMTAIAVLKLMEQGQLDLEAPISEYLPEFIDANPDNPVVILDLLHHTSGLADYTGDAWNGSDAEFANLNLEAHLTWLNDQDILAEPGVAYEYNNSGYALLALIVQRVSGQPFATFMATEIFQPLGMASTQVYRQLGQTVPNQATGYIVYNSDAIEPSSLPSVIAGDGNVFSSIIDLAQYDIALRQNQILSEQTLALAFTPGRFADGSSIDDGGEGYGMGWQIAADYVHHGGGWLGTSTYYRHYLDPTVSIIVLSNDEAYDPVALTEAIANFLAL